ncbi:MAG: hypothetical protein ACKO3T_24945, partial [Planctomycetaceae bacterium]
MLLTAAIAVVFSPISVRAQGEGVTAKEIETFGKDFQGKKIQMTATLSEVSDLWVKLKLKDDRFVGLFVEDSKGDLFQYAFATKEKYGRTLLQMKKGDRMLLTGTVRSVDGTYVLLVETISTEVPPGGDDKKQGEGVTAKEIETFGKDFQGKKI